MRHWERADPLYRRGGIVYYLSTYGLYQEVAALTNLASLGESLGVSLGVSLGRSACLGARRAVADVVGTYRYSQLCRAQLCVLPAAAVVDGGRCRRLSRRSAVVGARLTRRSVYRNCHTVRMALGWRGLGVVGARRRRSCRSPLSVGGR